MSPMRTPTTRRLVLARETVRSLTERPHPAITQVPQEMSSCGQECGCTGMMQAR
jgi:hypothetical protein